MLAHAGRILSVMLAAPMAGLAGDPPAPAPRPVSYDRDIRPLLSDRCFQCHGTDAATRQAGLRLDDPVSATGTREKGRAAIVPGDARASELFARITAHDPGVAMPPPTSTKRPFTPEQIDLIRRWIDAGAVYEPHWSFVPPVVHRAPEVSGLAPGTDAIDAFVAAALAERGLAFSAAADKATLLRRVTLDLTGLPPTPEERAAFLADDAPDAYERLVDRLLTTEPYVTRYAERMATPWLDQARYADTAGIHHDQGRSIWPYRDWVLSAFRDNMPFDRFVTEQLAGDLLPGATREQQIATGFGRCHVTSDEGGAIEEEYLLEYAVDRTSTTGAVFMGLTLGCARCHDHKFDPVTQTDFYSLLAFFNSIEEKGIDTRLDDPNVAYPPSITITTPRAAAEIAELSTALEHIRGRRDTLASDPVLARGAADFIATLQRDAGVTWLRTTPDSATSTGGTTLTPQPDGSVLASGANPDADTHEFTFGVDQAPRLLLLEGLRDPSFNNNRVGRAENGNAVVSALRVTIDDRPVSLLWAWANVEQMDDNFRVANLVTGGGPGWAVAAHQQPGDRAALFLLAADPGPAARVRVTIEYRSIYARHALGRTRLSFATIGDAGLARLPLAASAWFTAGPFPARTGEPVFDQAFGPEAATTIDLAAKFEDGKAWAYERRIVDAGSISLSNTVGPLYIARTVFAPSARRLDVALGTDDGVRVLAAGREVHVNRTERSLKPDQDHFAADLQPGATTFIYKVVNTGGPDGFAHRDLTADGTLAHALVPALFPEHARSTSIGSTLAQDYIRAHSPEYRAAATQADEAARRLDAAKAALPRTMVMKELAAPRPTHVMLRGQYDHPDTSRPVARGIPSFLGVLPPGDARDRLDLARWMTGPDNPLLARVTVNRFWAIFFGEGLVRTTEDFGLQGEYPSHPELLDTLASDFRTQGWDVKALVRRIVTSQAYRQSSRQQPAALAVDPENRLLAYFPRRRLAGEMIRDQALFAAGLLVERFGGPPVKPYQPPGLWEEVSMPDSNTGKFIRDTGDGLWRRSLYTFWKRAAPSPSMLTFDAPTRESCVVRRQSTNTPLQALVLWNDEQFVEAARHLAARVHGTATDDAARIDAMFILAASREPSDSERADMLGALGAYRERFAAAPADAAAFLAVGASPPIPGIEAPELASWAMLAGAVLSSDAVIVQR